MIQAQTPEPYSLKIELSKTKIYEGEGITAQFTVLSKTNPLQIEVLKFPEFRGFWMENLSLRQGIMNLTPNFDIFRGGLRPEYPYRAVIGSYLLYPMLKKNDWSIIPMKIVLSSNIGRESDEVQDPTHLLFPDTDLTIEPLPSIPKNLNEVSFIQGVGNLSLAVENTQQNFREGEPIILRFELSGEGNFFDINKLPFEYPNFLTISSERSFSPSPQIGLATRSKAFEITLSPSEKKSFELKLEPLLYFSTLTHQYEKLFIPSIYFNYSPKSEEEKTDIAFLPPSEHPSIPFLISEHPLFYKIQGLLLILIGSLKLLFIIKNRKGQALSFKQIQIQKYRKLKLLLKRNQKPEFIHLAKDIALECLNEKLGYPKVFHPNELIRKAKLQNLTPLSGKVEAVFLAYQQYQYSPFKESNASLSFILKTVKEIIY